MKNNSCGVATGDYGTKKLNKSLLNKCNNVNGRILLLEVDIDDDIYVFVNFYINDIESDKIQTLLELNNLFNKVE